MSQMNKGLTGAPKQGIGGKPLTAKPSLISSTPFKKAVNTATVNKANLAQHKDTLAKQTEKREQGNARMDKAIDAVMKGGDRSAQSFNHAIGKLMVEKADTAISGAKAGIKANTPKGPTIGAKVKPPPPTLTGAPKVGAKPGAPMSSPAVGGAGPAFKQAGVSNPMGRMGAKPGVAIGLKPKK